MFADFGIQEGALEPVPGGYSGMIRFFPQWVAVQILLTLIPLSLHVKEPKWDSACFREDPKPTNWWGDLLGGWSTRVMIHYGEWAESGLGM